jgi:hypothetical protein
VCLARQESPNLSDYDDPEVVWRLQKPHHAGVIVKSARKERIDQLLASYTERFRRDFVAALPAANTPFD